MANYTVIKKDEFLFEEGDESDCMYIVRSGQFVLFVREGDREKELTLANPGQLIGEMSLFDKKPRSATARASTDSSVVKLPYEQLEKQLLELPEWVRITMRTMSEKLRSTNKKFFT